ncbi:MAG: hypothetical protein IPN75_12200 [Dechloromonas sp.]|uniref:Uncharacterized protein n=1 Tax=Candidatus Dechloromonas phosphorivorans TaxID=2899244 RepID=A0A9D7QI69_9RHOO|nr:hypothetical protein [Candidatus Dechloromonas phosphorivorans]
MPLEDILQAQVIFIAGAKPAVAQPIIFRASRTRAANPDLKSSSPIRALGAQIADSTWRSGEVPTSLLFNGMLNVLRWRRPD